MSKQPSRSTPNRSRSTKNAFYRALLVSTISSVAVFSIADQSPMFFALTTLGIALVWLTSVRPSKPAPRAIINSVLLFVIAFAAFQMLRMGIGVSAFAVFVALLLVVKLLDLRLPRDDGQIIVLSVAILIAAVLTSNTFLTGVLLIISSVLLMRTVVLYQIYIVMHKSGAAQSRIKKGARIDIRSMMFATSFLCAVIGSVIFVVLPRNIGAQAFGQWGPASRSVSGFADSVELGRPGLISMSSVPVLDLTMLDRNGKNIGSEDSPAMYLRGAVLSEYNAGRWIASPVMSTPLTSRAKPIASNTTLKPRNLFGAPEWKHQFNITMRSSNDGQTYLFAPWKTVEFRVGAQPMRLGLDFDRGIFIKDGIGGRLEYSVRAVDTQLEEISYDESDVRDPLFATNIEPEIAALAREIVSTSGLDPDPAQRSVQDDQAVLRAIETRLRTQYSYSLDSQPVPPGEDATKWFLFERKQGHCEYYASALALMARSLGIPARVITGYVVSDFNTVTGQYTVRQSNAHAWVEAQVAPGIWRTFDGTPRDDFHSIHEPEPSIIRSLAKMYESIEFMWVRSVVGFDSKSRQSLIGGSSKDFGLTKLSERFMNRFAAGRDRLIIKALIIAVMVFAGAFVVGMLLIKYKTIWTSLSESITHWLSDLRRNMFDRVSWNTDTGYARLERVIHQRLDKLHIPKPNWVPLKAHIQDHHAAIELASPSLNALLGEASQLLYQHKFSSSSAQSAASKRVHELELSLRRSEKA